MKQQDFELAHQMVWQDLETLLACKKKRDRDPEVLQQLPVHYRQVCHHLALAKHRRYSTFLVDRLNLIVVECHNILYSQSARFRYQWLRFFIEDFPVALYRNRFFIRLSTALFCVPLFGMGILCYLDPELIYSIMDTSQVRGMESMYDPAARVLGREREADSDLYMFGFYIYNNIGIAFRSFALGIFFGIGSAFITVFNGIMIGAVGGHLSQLGYYSTFYPFVIGHGSFELTAIVLCGGAGLKIGSVLIAPGSQTRIAALKDASKDVIQIVFGAAAMLLIAAFLEAFWSSKASLPIPVKISVGVALWLMVLSYIGLVGRKKYHGSEPN